MFVYIVHIVHLLAASAHYIATHFFSSAFLVFPGVIVQHAPLSVAHTFDARTYGNVCASKTVDFCTGHELARSISKHASAPGTVLISLNTMVPS